MAVPTQELLDFLMKSVHSRVGLMLAGLGPQKSSRFAIMMQQGSAGSLARLVAEVSLID